DRLKLELRGSQLEYHELRILVISGCHRRVRTIKIVFTNLSGCAAHEVENTLLWFCSLIDMVVPTEHDVYSIPHEQRFQDRAELEAGGVLAGRGINRVVKECYFPFGC